MSDLIAGISIPDSKLARDATDLLREHGTPLLVSHSLRVYLFGAIRGRHRKLTFDHELLYLGAVFHDLGLTAKYRSQHHRFEIDSANAAQDFLRANAIDEASVGVVWDAIALHTTPEIPWHKRPEIALVTGGVEADVLGDGLGEIPITDRDAVLAAYPHRLQAGNRPGVYRRVRPQAGDDFRNDELRRAGTNATRLPPAEFLRADCSQSPWWLNGAVHEEQFPQAQRVWPGGDRRERVT